MSDSEDMDCPLCMEEIDITDKYFKPCPCGYQICRFCWNHINENLNGLCPEFRPLQPEELAQIKLAKKQKEREKREMNDVARRVLANQRVIQKNLVYVLGLPSRACTEETLRQHDYFGQYGKITKVVVNRRPTDITSILLVGGVYITYSEKVSAQRAIDSIDGSTTYGTTKYCSYYLRGQACQNVLCQYLQYVYRGTRNCSEPGEEAEGFVREDRGVRNLVFPSVRKDVREESALPKGSMWGKTLEEAKEEPVEEKPEPVKELKVVANKDVGLVEWGFGLCVCYAGSFDPFRNEKVPLPISESLQGVSRFEKLFGVEDLEDGIDERYSDFLENCIVEERSLNSSGSGLFGSIERPSRSASYESLVEDLSVKECENDEVVKSATSTVEDRQGKVGSMPASSKKRKKRLAKIAKLALDAVTELMAVNEPEQASKAEVVTVDTNFTEPAMMEFEAESDAPLLTKPLISTKKRKKTKQLQAISPKADAIDQVKLDHFGDSPTQDAHLESELVRVDTVENEYAAFVEEISAKMGIERRVYAKEDAGEIKKRKKKGKRSRKNSVAKDKNDTESTSETLLDRCFRRSLLKERGIDIWTAHNCYDVNMELLSEYAIGAALDSLAKELYHTAFRLRRDEALLNKRQPDAVLLGECDFESSSGEEFILRESFNESFEDEAKETRMAISVADELASNLEAGLDEKVLSIACVFDAKSAQMVVPGERRELIDEMRTEEFIDWVCEEGRGASEDGYASLAPDEFVDINGGDDRSDVDILELKLDAAIGAQLKIELELRAIITRNTAWIGDFMKELDVDAASVFDTSFLRLL